MYYHYWPCDWDNQHFKRSHVENMIAPRHIGCTSKCSGRSSDWSLSSMCFCLTAKQKEQLLPCFQVHWAYLQFEFANRDYEIINQCKSRTWETTFEKGVFISFHPPLLNPRYGDWVGTFWVGLAELSSHIHILYNDSTVYNPLKTSDSLTGSQTRNMMRLSESHSQVPAV